MLRPSAMDLLRPESDLAKTFTTLPTKSSSQSTKVGKEVLNSEKNRYPNILPYDKTRVILPSGQYINASRVTLHKTDYIITQGPLRSTIGDFWEMVSTQEVDVIVMLTELFDGQKSKCAKYWPDQGSPMVLAHKNLMISCESDATVSGTEHKTRDLRVLKTNGSGGFKLVRQFQFVGWPDFGVPSDLDDLIRFDDAISAADPKRLLVHCSAGVGRTGTFLLMHEGREIPAKDFDPIALVKQMRSQRMEMIERVEQFVLAVNVVRKSSKVEKCSKTSG